MKILVPVDGSDLALDAVRHALHLQRQGLQASLCWPRCRNPPLFMK
jgi:nucleotide-binding universal stress UspA family protein